jgi:hypothetical protein
MSANNCGNACSLQWGKPGPDTARTLFGGFIGTVAITFMMYVIAPMMGMTMDVAQMLGSMLGGSWWAGMALHLINGTVLFPLIYGFALFGVLPGAPVLKGTIWGAILWLIAQAMVMPVMGAGFFSAHGGGVMAAAGSLMGHLLYGSLLGAIAGSRLSHHSAGRAALEA